MRRSGSTLAYQIGCALAGEESGLRRVNVLPPGVENRSDWYVVKTHGYHPEMIQGIESGKIRVITTIRDPRDVVVSTMTLNSDSFKGALRKTKRGICSQQLWLENVAQLSVLRYEDFFNNIGFLVKAIADVMDREIRQEEIDKLAEEYSFENNKKRSAEITKTEADFLFPGHTQDGIVGKWKSKLTNKQVKLAQRFIGSKWFEENDYRLWKKIILEYGDWKMALAEDQSRLARRGLNVYEPAKVQFLKEHIQPGDVFVDVGACEGFFTLLAASLVGSEGAVIAFEPNRKNFEMLKANIARNNLTNVHAYPYAVANYNAIANLYLGNQVGLHTLVPGLKGRSEEYEEVRVIKLGALGWDGRPTDGLKIDVEGMEVAVLRGASELLRLARYIAIDVHPSLGVDVSEVEFLLHEQNFQIRNVKLNKNKNEIFAWRGK